MGFGTADTFGESLAFNGLVGVASKVARLAQRGTLQRQVNRGLIPEADWRGALRTMCEEARIANVPPEQLLIELKQALAVLCDACGVPYGPPRTEFTSRLVTMTIEEYYGARAGCADGRS